MTCQFSSIIRSATAAVYATRYALWMCMAGTKKRICPISLITMNASIAVVVILTARVNVLMLPIRFVYGSVPVSK